MAAEASLNNRWTVHIRSKTIVLPWRRRSASRNRGNNVLHRNDWEMAEMTNRCVGLVVVGEVVTVVDAEVPIDAQQPITILADDTWRLHNQERPQAYAFLHQRCADYMRENKIRSVAVKASAIPTGPTKLGLLTSAEVRGVIIAASASVCEVKTLSKAVISRTYGDRKVDEYLQDDIFWGNHTKGGKLRKTSREAAMLLIASRNS